MKAKWIIKTIFVVVFSIASVGLLFRALVGNAIATVSHAGALQINNGASHSFTETISLAVLDPAALTISALQAKDITPFSAAIAWQTDLPADSRVEFWTTDSTSVKSVSQPTLTLTHEILLTGLAGNAIYHYRVISKDNGGQQTTSAEQSFTTPSSRIMIGENGGFLVDGKPFFPIMQWAQCAHRIAYQKTLGINTFMGMGCSSDTPQSYLNTCQTNNVWGVIQFDAGVKNHPNLLGWYSDDEPEMPRGSRNDPPLLYPDELREVYENIRAQDSAHPFLTTFTSRFAERFGGYPWMGSDTEEYFDYINATDIPGFDHYPVYGWCRPDWLHEISGFQDEFMGYTSWRPTYQWIEAVRTSGQNCELSGRGDNDGPYPSETRNEVWQAIVHGVKAIGYFTHSWECPGYTQFCLTSEQEAELSRTNQQITTLAPIILSLDRNQEVTDQEAGGGRVDVMAREYNGELYIFAVNLERSPETVTFAIEGMVGPTVEVIDESRMIDLEENRFVDGFESLGVHIYKIPGYAQTPRVTLHGAAANQAIRLNWAVNFILPVTTTWDIDYYTATTTAPFTVTGLISTTNSLTLTDHVQNYQWYTVTLYAMPGKWLSDTVRVMPTDRFVYLPLVLR